MESVEAHKNMLFLECLTDDKLDWYTFKYRQILIQ